ncbi:hypothetical protein KSP40_PGU020184 [Platanthera guangdongensis]|uniref:Uncharacterized protein n=1 Tax=Platanthera guangdongensis TaxID=2320717 RepID=A0ABR2M1H0_9ASPA
MSHAKFALVRSAHSYRLNLTCNLLNILRSTQHGRLIGSAQPTYDHGEGPGLCEMGASGWIRIGREIERKREKWKKEKGINSLHIMKNIAKKLEMDVPMAVALAFSHLDVANFKTRNVSINNISKFETVEVSLLLCNDQFIQNLNKEWRDEDQATDVLSMSQHIPELNIPVLMLGDIVISIETALRQAEERGHTLLDEVRILMVHGLLHLLGFDHEIGDAAEEEMEMEEELVLTTLGWKGKGLIKCSYDSITDGHLQVSHSDGTLLNRKSQISMRTAEALNEAISRGVHIVIATGKVITRLIVSSFLKQPSCFPNYLHDAA